MPSKSPSMLLLLALLLLAFSCKADTWDDYYEKLYEYHQRLNDNFHDIGAYFKRLKQYQNVDDVKKQTDNPVVNATGGRND